MINFQSKVCTATLALAIGLSTYIPAMATPLIVPTYKAVSDVQTVQSRREIRRGYWNGNRGYRDRRDGYRRHSDGYWYPLAAFGAGAIIGGALTNRNQPRRVVEMDDEASNWCANRYRSYRAYDNT